jgi:DNA replication ATP-dependent helicase Dna2
MQSEGRPRWKHDQTCPSNLTNPTEARLVAQLVTALVLGGVPAENVAVISPLRSQLKLLRRRLQHVKNLEINTVDKLQGMDRDCIIISMVRSNAEGVVGHLLQDRRRINVAVSRARKKLLIVGSATTLGKASTTCELVDLMKARGWILSLPPKAHELYDERNLDAVSLLTATQ